MLRFFLHYVLPLLLPFLIYLAYVGLTRGRTPGWLEQTPWLLLTGAGVVLLAASLLSWSLTSGAPPEEAYQPPRLEDGRVVPGRTVPPQ